VSRLEKKSSHALSVVFTFATWFRELGMSIIKIESMKEDGGWLIYVSMD
jgi:hypothetical protein